MGGDVVGEGGEGVPALFGVLVASVVEGDSRSIVWFAAGRAVVGFGGGFCESVAA